LGCGWRCQELQGYSFWQNWWDLVLGLKLLKEVAYVLCVLVCQGLLRLVDALLHELVSRLVTLEYAGRQGVNSLRQGGTHEPASLYATSKLLEWGSVSLYLTHEVSITLGDASVQLSVLLGRDAQVNRSKLGDELAVLRELHRSWVFNERWWLS
jgi:hypothetical protein